MVKLHKNVFCILYKNKSIILFICEMNVFH